MNESAPIQSVASTTPHPVRTPEEVAALAAGPSSAGTRPAVAALVASAPQPAIEVTLSRSVQRRPWVIRLASEAANRNFVLQASFRTNRAGHGVTSLEEAGDVAAAHSRSVDEAALAECEKELFGRIVQMEVHKAAERQKGPADAQERPDSGTGVQNAKAVAPGALG